MVFPVRLDQLASTNVERFHSEAAQHRLVSAALGLRSSRVLSLGRGLWAMATESVGALRELVWLTRRPPAKA